MLPARSGTTERRVSEQYSRSDGECEFEDGAFPVRILSPAFHTSYQYNLADSMPEHEWTFFLGVWSPNRPRPSNIRHVEEGPKSSYDVALVHSPEQFYSVRNSFRASGINLPIIYICHYGLVSGTKTNGVLGNSYDQFLADLEDHVIVCVSHFMVPQWRFRSKRLLTVIPHYVPENVVGRDRAWRGTGKTFVNAVNNFYQPNRGTGEAFWKKLPIQKVLYGNNNSPDDAGPLETFEDFKSAMADAAGFLWVADNVAMSFAPLEAMALGVPVVAPRRADWPIVIVHEQTGLLYEWGNVGDCMYQCMRLLQEPNLAQSLSINGAAAVRSLFTRNAFRRGWLSALDAATA